MKKQDLNSASSAQVNAAKTAASVIVIATSHRDRMSDHREKAFTPSKLIKNAVGTAHEGSEKFARGYAQAVDAVFNIKNGDQMKAAITYICERYAKATKTDKPRKGFRAEIWVHEYFEKLIKANAANVAACRNYLLIQRATAQATKTAAK